MAILVAAWAILPPYVGPELGAQARLEVADHVVPGAIVIAIALVAFVYARPGPLPYVAGLAVTLSGLWITVTHVPLIADAADGLVGWGAALHHSLPGAAVLAVGALWAARVRHVTAGHAPH